MAKDLSVVSAGVRATRTHRRPGSPELTAMPIKPELRYYYPINWPQVSCGCGSCAPRAAASCGRPDGQVVRIWAMAACGMRRGRAGVMAAAARSPALPRPRSNRAGPPRSCSRQRISTTTPRTAAGDIATSRRSASGAICSMTGPSIGAASGSPCAGAEPWAICSRASVRPDPRGVARQIVPAKFCGSTPVMLGCSASCGEAMKKPGASLQPSARSRVSCVSFSTPRVEPDAAPSGI